MTTLPRGVGDDQGVERGCLGGSQGGGLPRRGQCPGARLVASRGRETAGCIELPRICISDMPGPVVRIHHHDVGALGPDQRQAAQRPVQLVVIELRGRVTVIAQPCGSRDQRWSFLAHQPRWTNEGDHLVRVRDSQSIGVEEPCITESRQRQLNARKTILLHENCPGKLLDAPGGHRPPIPPVEVAVSVAQLIVERPNVNRHHPRLSSTVARSVWRSTRPRQSPGP